MRGQAFGKDGNARENRDSRKEEGQLCDGGIPFKEPQA